MAVRPVFALPRLAGLAIAVFGVFGFSGLLSAAEPIINVTLDRASVVRLDRPADTVIIGNPMIADATVRDNVTLIVTGKSFGTTNLIILDKDGREVSNQLVTVAASDDNLVTVYNRSGRQTYSCTPVCEPVISIGDDTSTFGDRTSQIQGRNSLIPEGGK
jgi:Flp pilus assembly secretin CpaC